MNNNKKYTGLEIAIIGMSCHIPGADDWRTFWKNLSDGKESIQYLTNEEVKANGVSDVIIKQDEFIKAKSVIKNKDCFDHNFFKYSKHEAKMMNPIHRVFHQTVWEALEDAGYTPEQVNGKISLYAGAGSDTNWKAYTMMENNDENQRIDDYTLDFITSKDHLATLISYKLDLRGPAFAINTACSTSLSAIHLACKGLLLGEAKMALAGGITLATHIQSGYIHEEGHIYSKDGHCRAFDKDASGTVGSEGSGVVVLKRLSEAIKDNDQIYAVIKGSAANNDGNRKVGYTAPSVEGQMECIRTAQRTAHTAANTIGYVEAHGTGTSLGDPIEVEALNLAFDNDKNHSCALGSVKTNFGHTDSASGVIGLIKAVLCLKHKQIPASLHYKEANPNIKFEEGPFYVNDKLNKWEPKNGTPLRAGVSSFGIGGTNVHLILEEAPAKEATPTSNDSEKVFTLSAQSENTLKRYMDKFKNFIDENPELNLDDMAYTLLSRKQFPSRLAFRFKDRKDLLDKLSADIKVHNAKDDKAVVFLFPGLGAQYLNMAKDLYKNEETFQQKMDEGFKIIQELTGKDYSKILYSKAKKSAKINDASIAEPVLFITEIALAQLLKSVGINCNYMLGHGVGEYTAACLSGVISFEDALKLIVKRTAIMSKIKADEMLSALMIEEEAKKFLSDDITLAAVNGSQQVIFAGNTKAIDGLKNKLDAQDIINSKLSDKHGHHTAITDKAKEAFKKEFAQVNIAKIRVPYISNLTAELATDNALATPDYWINQMSKTVRFYDGLKTLLQKEEDLIFIEVGPGQSLSNLLKREKVSMHKDFVSTNIVKYENEEIDDITFFANNMLSLWEGGININLEKFYKDKQRNRISLPTYTFEQNRFIAEVNPFAIMKAAQERTRTVTTPSVAKNGKSTEPAVQQVVDSKEKLTTVVKETKVSNTQERLINVFKNFFDIEDINPNEDLFDLGVDSLNGLLILKKIKNEFKIEFSLQDFLGSQTIGEIVSHIDKKKSESSVTKKTITI